MRSSFNVRLACQVLGYTRQAYYKERTSWISRESCALGPILTAMRMARKRNPTKGCRAVYEIAGPQWPIGRDKSIELMMNYGYRVKYPKSYKKATQAGNREFENLLVQKEVTGINQVWQADMAYYLQGESRFYTMYITDVYSQEIVGYGAYSTNVASNYYHVLSLAIRKQKKYTNGLKRLIHHSDGGKQYESLVYKNLCKRNGIKQSMCIYSYENPYAEKTNDLINNGYLNVWKPKTLDQLKIQQAKAVLDHNLNSRKRALGKLSPLAFKGQYLKQLLEMKAHPLMLKPSNPEQPRNKKIEIN